MHVCRPEGLPEGLHFNIFHVHIERNKSKDLLAKRYVHPL